MAKKTTLEELGDMLTHVVKHMATKEELGKLATNVASLATQVTSIEAQLRGMKHVRLETRVADLEEHVFHMARS